ncbi:MAG: hypothetical protein COZ06_13970 [Armatimonadetes bacterium CG_4_10_14_3_um_filter_66_18]|nr:HD domain-containing protein [Armatimonadota bacterium]OIO97158.1 MAG: hypothetical protein AUJ96_23755 [Armatimonadetes bacterium CG2_30_66_41]PIU92722.1 MAG: hypothetical protein COS65_16475 [Armatimonadetes bacterium CG06_land_8_20_14_3_00_66_21]PIX45156.1 MAG: hypothetical protein COZ57_16240 [Armatimonadetes bacterium CG_4_8_14_3_um_filter_66_20]PIY49519.1 MAG: hypothetical protein COZ06_13970 [Armatimonadetes bacterium CG_4_10_14_3_um_filter_66_18]PIZ45320.1 MAG: hypothetical protein 
MADKQYVESLRAGEPLDSVFIARNKRLVDFRNKSGQYLSIGLADRTGQIDARLWDGGPKAAEGFAEGDVVRVTGKVDAYRGSLQVVLTGIGPCKEGEYEPADFVARTDKDLDALTKLLQGAILSVENEHLKALLLAFFKSTSFLQRFVESPAAKTIHHPFVGGMAEHIASVIQLCETLCKVHPRIDRELLLTGALLHDIGKLRELDFAPAIEYTDEGELLGHLVIGTMMVEEKIRDLSEFPEELRLRVLHMIVSHHGELEFGSPKTPATLEAVALNLVENMDAKVQNFEQILQQHDDSDRTWTDYNTLLKRRVFLGSPEPAPPEPKPAPEQPDLFSQ